MEDVGEAAISRVEADRGWCLSSLGFRWVLAMAIVESALALKLQFLFVHLLTAVPAVAAVVGV